MTRSSPFAFFTEMLFHAQVLAHIGQFGRAQWKIFFLLSLVSATSGLAVVVFAFTGQHLHRSSPIYRKKCLSSFVASIADFKWQA